MLGTLLGFLLANLVLLELLLTSLLHLLLPNLVLLEALVLLQLLLLDTLVLKLLRLLLAQLFLLDTLLLDAVLLIGRSAEAAAYRWRNDAGGGRDGACEDGLSRTAVVGFVEVAAVAGSLLAELHLRLHRRDVLLAHGS